MPASLAAARCVCAQPTSCQHDDDDAQVKKRERAEADILRLSRTAQALQQKVQHLKKQLQHSTQEGRGPAASQARLSPHEDSEGDEDSAYGLTGEGR